MTEGRWFRRARRTTPLARRQLSRQCGALLLFVGVVFAASAHGASQLWPNNPLYFFSEDLSPVRVTDVGYGPTEEPNPPIFTVPRAWIVFTDYSPLHSDFVPDPLATKGIILSLADPNGEALSIRTSRLAREAGISLSEALKRLRPETYNVDLTLVDRDMTTNQWRDRFVWGELVSALADSDKINDDDIVRDKRSSFYFSKAGIQEFAGIYCSSDDNPIAYCNYYVRLSRRLIGKMIFFDFRMHGGTAYANARIRRARDILCRQDVAFCPDPDPAYR